MPLFRAELHGLPEQLRHLDERVSHYDRRMGQLAQDNAQARTLMTIPGVGPLGATALLAAVREDPQLFKHGRGLAVWLGLLPRQHSTGGKPQLLAITKRGDAYLRNLLIHSARAVLRHVENKDDDVSRWARALKARRHGNVAAVALASKMARIAYAVLSIGQPYSPPAGAAPAVSA
jgi:transposase